MAMPQQGPQISGFFEKASVQWIGQEIISPMSRWQGNQLTLTRNYAELYPEERDARWHELEADRRHLFAVARPIARATNIPLERLIAVAEERVKSKYRALTDGLDNPDALAKDFWTDYYYEWYELLTYVFYRAGLLVTEQVSGYDVVSEFFSDITSKSEALELD